MEKLDKKAFTEKIFDFEKKKEWEFQGDRKSVV
jgi:hypothetical protein